MSNDCNLKLKDNIEADILTKYGFKPKYDTDTGEVVEYYIKFNIRGNPEKHFTFICETNKKMQWFFRRFSYKAWMTGYEWSDIASKECMELIFKLIKDDIIEIA